MVHFVLVIEDDALLADALRMYLEKEGYQVEVASDGAAGLARAVGKPPHLLILDIMLPKLDGWEICRQFRRISQAPVLILTARGDEADKVQGFGLGADDYLTKPFSMQEFLARVRALLRRVPPDQETGSSPLTGVLSFPELLIDSLQHRVELSGKKVRLTPKEFALLWALASRAGTVVSREKLAQEVWGYPPGGDDRTVHTHVNRLRMKLESGHPYHYIHTLWGVGYKFEVTEAESA